MYKHTFLLKQHTPIIHFQHDQDGATLRATEVKPKFDRFLLKLIGGGDMSSGIRLARQKKWLSGKDDHHSLNYKVRIQIKEQLSDSDKKSLSIFEKIRTENGEKISKTVFRDGGWEIKRDSFGAIIYEREPGLKGYFGNIEKETERKELVMANIVEVVIQTMHKQLLDLLKENISQFFFTANFSSRSSKGFGSFTVVNDQGMPPAGFYSFFDVSATGNIYQIMQQVFQEINLLYSALRAGINLKKPAYQNVNGRRQKKLDANGLAEFIDIYYFKSLLFLFAKERLNSKWEKRTIKETFFRTDRSYTDKRTGGRKIKYYGLDTQIRRRIVAGAVHGPLSYNPGKYVLIKDLLGLSTVESWISYGNAQISKTQAQQTESGLSKVNEKKQTIARYKSPVQFKPVFVSNNKVRVFLQIMENEPVIGDQWFCIEAGNPVTPPLFLKTPSSGEFSVKKFFDFVFLEKKENGEYLFDIDKHVDSSSGFHNTQEHAMLSRIVDNVRLNLNK